MLDENQKTPPSPRRARFYGDSHARLLQTIPKALEGEIRFKGLEITGQVIHGASVIGLGRRTSTLGLHDSILTSLDAASQSILAFGQVDLELGLYYRLVVKEEAISPSDFVTKLVDVYTEFLRGAYAICPALIVKGANLTVIKSRSFGVAYVARIVSENVVDKTEKLRLKAILSRRYHSFSDRNKITLDFNAALKEVCSSLGIGYFDINDSIAVQGQYLGFDLEAGVRDEFLPSHVDHHVVDSLFVRKRHYVAALGAIVQATGR